jgi:hypothetical protein
VGVSGYLSQIGRLRRYSLLFLIVYSFNTCHPLLNTCFFEFYLQVSNIIIKELANNPKVYIWDGEGIVD